MAVERIPVMFGDFYRHALEVNYWGNNRGVAHARPRRHGHSFQPHGGLAPAPACALLNPDHRGDVRLCIYVDGQGGRWLQHLCRGHRGRFWRPIGDELHRASNGHSRRDVTPETPPARFRAGGV